MLILILLDKHPDMWSYSSSGPYSSSIYNFKRNIHIVFHSNTGLDNASMDMAPKAKIYKWDFIRLQLRHTTGSKEWSGTCVTGENTCQPWVREGVTFKIEGLAKVDLLLWVSERVYSCITIYLLIYYLFVLPIWTTVNLLFPSPA